MFERFTELGHGFVGTEHLLPGVAGAGAGLGTTILADAGLERDALRSEIVAAELLAERGLTLRRIRELVREALAAA